MKSREIPSVTHSTIGCDENVPSPQPGNLPLGACAEQNSQIAFKIKGKWIIAMRYENVYRCGDGSGEYASSENS